MCWTWDYKRSKPIGMSNVRTSSDCMNCSTKSPRSWKSLPTIWPNAQWNWEVWRWARFKSFQRNRGSPAIHSTWPLDRNTSLHYPARWQIVARALDAQLIPQAKHVMLTRRICSRRFRVALTSCSGSSKRTRKQSTEPLVRDALKSRGLLGAADSLDKLDLTNAQKRDERFYPKDAVLDFDQKVREAEPGAKGKFAGN